jgi:probable phosphoglycerate mutase
MTAITRLLLARHGRTAANALGHFQGHGGAALDEVGRDEAARLARRMSHSGATRVVASDLVRAVETARPTAEALGLELVTDRRLREVDVGTWGGLTAAEVEKKFPEEHAAWRAGVDIPRGGGETYEDAGNRIRGVLEELVRVAPGATIVVVSHGAALQALGRLLLGLSATTRVFWGLRNTGLCEVTHEPHGMVLRSWNDIGHLETY